jgi:hypothetical protein
MRIALALVLLASAAGFQADLAQVSALVDAAGKEAITVLNNVGNPAAPQICFYLLMENGGPSTQYNFHCRPADFGAVNTFKKGKGVNEFAVAYSPRESYAGGHHPYDACDADLITCQAGGKRVSCSSPLIVMAVRGGCPFYTKYLNILRATKGKAKGVILADDKERGPTGLLRLTRGKAKVDPLEVEAQVPVVSTTYREAEHIRTLNSKNTNHLLCGMEFSEHEGVHSWKHRVQEMITGHKLLRVPTNAKLWETLAAAQSAQGGREADVSIVQDIAVALKTANRKKEKEKRAEL